MNQGVLADLVLSSRPIRRFCFCHRKPVKLYKQTHTEGKKKYCLKQKKSVWSTTDRGEDFSGLLDSGDAGPLPLLEELHPGGVVQGGRWVRPEEGGEALAVGQSRGAGAVGQLRKEDRQTDKQADRHRSETWS